MGAGPLLTWCGITSLTLAATTNATPPAETVIARIDLSKTFGISPGAVFTATQSAPIESPIYEGQELPGAIHLCVQVAPMAPCTPKLDGSLETAAASDLFSDIHYLEIAEVVLPRGPSDPPLLYLQVASIPAANGSQRHAALMLAYRPAKHRFEQIFEQQFGGNMNQEVRYIGAGPLKGAMIYVHPTSDRPFAYWVTVSRLSPDYTYKRVLQYRSATRYGDGNPLAVIDSEMPNILHRIGFWRRGDPLPLPAGPCPRPHLVKQALWCSPP